MAAAKQTITGVLACNADVIDLRESRARVLDNGDVETEIDILELVRQNQVGGAGEFDPAEFADDMIRIHAEEAERGFFPPIVLGHPKKPDGTPDDGAPSVGKILALRKVGTRLRATVRLLADFAERVRKGEFSHTSPEITVARDQKTGEVLGAKLFRLGVTDVPFQRGADGQPVAAFALSAVDDGKEHDMTISMDDVRSAAAEVVDEKITALEQRVTQLSESVTPLVGTDEQPGIGARLEELSKAIADLSERQQEPDEKVEQTEAKLSEAGEGVESLREQVAALSEQVETVKTTMGQLSEENKALTNERDQKVAREILQTGLDSGRITRAMLSLPAGAKLDAEFNAVDELTNPSKLGFASLSAARKTLSQLPVVADPQRKSVDGATAGDGHVNLSEFGIHTEADAKRHGFDDLEAARKAYASVS